MAKRSIALLATCFLVFSSSFAAYAQADPGYRIGDRVEADPTTSSDGPYKKWLKATIIDVVQNGYLVVLDGEFPRRGAIINYDSRSSRRIAGRVAVPNCPRGGQTTSAVEAEVRCWDEAAKRQAQANAQQARQPAPAAPANPRNPQGKTAAEYQAEAAALEAQAAAILANQNHRAANPPANNVQGAKFRVGDRVETDPYRYDEGSPNKHWQKGTIKQVFGPHNYLIAMDFPPGTEQPRDVYQKDEPYNLRALAEPNRGAPTFNSRCPASDPDTGASANVHRIIREQFDRPQEPGKLDGRQTVTFQSFKVLDPTPYDVSRDWNSGANPLKNIIPVYATLTVCTERGAGYTPYIRRFVDRSYRCFETKNPQHDWNCSWDSVREEWIDGRRVQ